MRTSSYTIYVDLPSQPDDMLLVHGYTGAYDKVSKGVATYVRSLEVRRPPKPLYGDWTPEPPTDGKAELPSEETIQILRRRGYLTDMTVESEEQFFRKFVEKMHTQRLKTSLSYIFMPTYNCNLRCAYCFQDYMRTNPLYSHLLRTMSHKTVDRIFQGMTQIESGMNIASGARVHRSIGFFGGEPLLAATRPAVERIMEKALDMGTATIWAVSNATELEAYEDLLSPQKLCSIQITLDGPPREHDRRRIYADGSGSFDKIARNINMALERGVAISVRLNLDRNNLSQLPELADVIQARGWDKHSGFSAYTAPIRAENDNVDRATTMNTWQLDQALTDMQKQFPVLSMFNRPDDGIKNSARLLFEASGTGVPILKESFCSAHTGMYIFDVFADIYACWERTGDSSTRIGHVAEDGTLNLNQELMNYWRSRTVATNPVCSNCRYALHCGGGCAVLALGKTGKYHMNFCDGFATRFRASVAEAYVDHISGVAVSAKAARVCDQ
jgi:uncharacterized protein